MLPDSAFPPVPPRFPLRNRAKSGSVPQTQLSRIRERQLLALGMAGYHGYHQSVNLRCPQSCRAGHCLQSSMVAAEAATPQ
jgi:hypothetical protein